MKRLNYSTQAIEGIRATRHLYAEPEIANQVIDLLVEGEKFQLPDNGHLLYRWGEIPDMKEPGRLPFGVTITEVPWMITVSDGGTLAAHGVPNATSTKQIAISFELGPYEDQIRSAEDDPLRSILEARYDRNSSQPPLARAVISIFFRNGGGWEINPAALIHPYEDLIHDRIDMKIGAVHKKLLKEQRSKMREMGHTPTGSSKKGYIVAVLMPGDYARDYLKMPELEMARINNDLGNEIGWIYQLVTALSCSNVTVDKIEPSRLLQKQRASNKNKAPLFTEHVLTLDGTELKAYNPQGMGGTHASPRTHLRRGHIRNLADGRQVWVNDTIVNPGNGFADKTYDMKERLLT